VVADRIRKLTILWLVPILFLLHNGEEAIMMRATLDEVRSGMPRFLRIFLPPVSPPQFLMALALLTALVFLCAWFGQLDRDRSWGVYVMVGLEMVLLLNVFAHGVTMALVGSYTAGSVTSLLVNLPFALYVLRRAWKESWVGQGAFLLMIPLAFIAHTPVLFGFLFVSGYLTRFLLGA
jgi:hypothetical protein